MSRITDVTDKTQVGSVDGEYATLTKCVCGAKFDYWDVILYVYPDSANTCPECGCKLYFSMSISVFQVED